MKSGGLLSLPNVTSGAQLPSQLNVQSSVKVITGGELELRNPKGRLVAHDLSLESGAILDWIAGTIDLTAGALNPGRPVLSIGASIDTSILILRNGATAVIPSQLSIGGALNSNGKVVLTHVTGSRSTKFGAQWFSGHRTAYTGTNGDMLLQLGRTREARAEYRATLVKEPGRRHAMRLAGR